VPVAALSQTSTNQAPRILRTHEHIRRYHRWAFPESTEWEGVRVDLADVVFDPLSEHESEDLGLKLLVPRLKVHEVEQAHNAPLRALDHGLGERQFAECVRYTEVAPLVEPPDDYIPLLELEGFIRWRNEWRRH
jgi:hypothetical protein